MHSKYVRDNSNIVDVIKDFVNLKKNSLNWVGLCPFHSEKSPSFNVNQRTQRYKCFGCGKSGDSIDFLREHENKSFAEAVKYIASRFNLEIEGEKFESQTKAIYSKEIYNKTIHEKGYNISPLRKLSERELRNLFSAKVWDYLLGKFAGNVDAIIEHLHIVCENARFYAIDYYEQVSNKEDGKQIVHRYTAHDNYPIFCYKEIDTTGKNEDGSEKYWFKIYQPFYQKTDKGDYRFIYLPNGKKPKNFVHCLSYVKAKFDSFQESKMEEIQKTEETEYEEGNLSKIAWNVKEHKLAVKTDPKLSAIIKVSGGSDGLNLMALDYDVIWTNSESDEITESQYRSLRNICHKFYVLNDLDDAGNKSTHEFGMKHMDARLVYLPNELKQHYDYLKSKPCKDVKNYLDKFSVPSLKKIIEGGLAYQFWSEKKQFDRSGIPIMFEGDQQITYKLEASHLWNFLSRQGFHTWKEKIGDDDYETHFVRVEGKRISKIQASDIKQFLRNFLETGNKGGPFPSGLRSLFITNKIITSDNLNLLAPFEPQFRTYTHDKQYYFFLNEKGEDQPIEITAKGITAHKVGEFKGNYWNTDVRPYKFTKLEQPFFEYAFDADGIPTIEIKNRDGYFWKYLINTTRLHWKVEQEGIEDTDENGKKYIRKTLTQHEIAEENLCLANRLYTLGYLLHQYKDPSKPYIPYCLEYIVDDEGQAQGGSGKGIFMKFITHFMVSFYLDGRDAKKEDDPHAFARVTKKTKYIRLEDTGPNFNLEKLFNKATEGLVVNPKGRVDREISFDDSPKMAISSNYMPRNLNDSVLRRLLFTTFSDYYHFGSTSHDSKYPISVSPEIEFGINLFKDDFPASEWNNAINLALQALVFYLNCPVKIDPPMKGVIERHNNLIMGEAFEQWAWEYFVDGNRLNVMVDRKNCQWDYNYGKKGRELITPQLFKKKLRAFCIKNNWILDPKEKCNDQEKKNIKQRPQPGFIDLEKGKDHAVDSSVPRVQFFILAKNMPAPGPSKTDIDTAETQETPPTISEGLPF